MNKKCCGLTKNAWNRSCCLRPFIILVWTLEICIFLPIAVAVSVIITALVIGPAYIMQLYKLVKIMLLWCCKTNDKKSDEEKTDLEKL